MRRDATSRDDRRNCEHTTTSFRVASRPFAICRKMSQGIENNIISFPATSRDVAAVTTPHFHGFSVRLKESYALIRMESCTKMNEDLLE